MTKEKDFEYMVPYQIECVDRLGKTVRIEQEAYISQHPEVKSMLDIFVTKMIHKKKTNHILAEAATHFSRPISDLDQEIREYLGSSSEGPYVTVKASCHATHHKYYEFQNNPNSFKYKDFDLEKDLSDLSSKNLLPTGPTMEVSDSSSQHTLSSSFMSLVTSDTTLPTPEPIPTPEPTFEELIYEMVSNVVDKAIYLNVTEGMLKYDTAYVELIYAVERAMEIPIIEIREDITELITSAYTVFEKEIIHREEIAAEIAWSNRMRKKQKKTLRSMRNFTGYQSSSSEGSSASKDSLDDERFLPLPPCKCFPKNKYNRYPKDRFGIYLPTDSERATRVSKTAVPCPYLIDHNGENKGEDEDDIA